METAELAAVAGGLGAVAALLARGRSVVLIGLALLVAAEIALAASDGGGADLSSAAGAALALIALAGVGAAAAVLVKRPAWAPLALLAAAPFRLPLDFGSEHTLFVAVAQNGQLGRLLPLYFVLLAALAALAWRLTAGGERPAALPRALAWPAALFFAWACASLLWADDPEAGRNLLMFFTLPFAALLAIVARSPFPDWLPGALARVAVALALLFAAVGLFQAVTHDLLFYAPNLDLSNANSDFFRVTSLFVDPSLYGRHVVLGLAVVLVLMLARRLEPRRALVLIAVLWAGLFFSYSQSSMTALFAVLLALAAFAGGPQVRRAAVAVCVLLAVAGAAYLAVNVEGDRSLRRETSDRSQRIEETWNVVEKHPLAGVGIGGQPLASRRLSERPRTPTEDFVSHTTPLTVLAELGLIGLALYAWLLAGGALMLERIRRQAPAFGLSLLACLLALFVHALSYSGFLEDPLTWLVLGLGAAHLIAHPRSTAERVERRMRRRAGTEAA
jgi:hypothetical protein